ncbi:FAD-dependent thymidylate synthase [Methanosarcinales archaeon]|nr:MAG: FAD-dependent thymidylate synthase [Methanosarcinales archaeon]
MKKMMKTPEVELLSYYYPENAMKEVLRISDGKEVPLKVIVRRDYSSVLEHIVFTFKITCSIAASREILEHRIASHTARSTRYCDESNFQIILPPLKNHSNEETLSLLTIIEAVARFTQNYYDILKTKHGKEIARYILPLCTETQYILTMNARSLINFLGLRLCVRASPELREIARQMLGHCRRVAPEIFDLVGCRGVNFGVCPEGKARPDDCPHKARIPVKK